MPGNYTALHYHLVFGTKERSSSIPPEIAEELYAYLGGVLEREHGKLLACGGMPDHVHVLASIPSRLAVADMVRKLKGSSSRWLGERLPDKFAWQIGYGAFSVSPSRLQGVARYIRNQEVHHRDRSFAREVEDLSRAGSPGLLPRSGVNSRANTPCP